MILAIILTTAIMILIAYIIPFVAVFHTISFPFIKLNMLMDTLIRLDVVYLEAFSSQTELKG